MYLDFVAKTFNGNVLANQWTVSKASMCDHGVNVFETVEILVSGLEKLLQQHSSITKAAHQAPNTLGILSLTTFMLKCNFVYYTIYGCFWLQAM